jgi:hypothetical protein
MGRNYRVFGLCPSSGILKTREHNVSETGSLSVLRVDGLYIILFVIVYIRHALDFTGQLWSVAIMEQRRYANNGKGHHLQIILP